jgi:uncharacterized protein (UPF0264 family)
MTALLVSVRNAAEAEEAIAGGAAIIDVKEPNNGPLGLATAQARSDIQRSVAGRVSLSVAMGELRDFVEFKFGSPDIAYFKVGLAELSGEEWHPALLGLHQHFALPDRPRLVAVGYADSFRSHSPSPYDVMEFAIEHHLAGFLIDTWEKGAGNLLSLHSIEEIAWICRQCRSAGIPVALAGSLGRDEIVQLLPAAPDYVAVRGAACVGGRNGTVSRHRVAELVELLTSAPC